MSMVCGLQHELYLLWQGQRYWSFHKKCLGAWGYKPKHVNYAPAAVELKHWGENCFKLPLTFEYCTST